MQESLTNRTVPRYHESLTVEGRIGNKLDSLTLMRPETLLKVDMPQVQVGHWRLSTSKYLSEVGTYPLAARGVLVGDLTRIWGDAGV